MIAISSRATTAFVLAFLIAGIAMANAMPVRATRPLEGGGTFDLSVPDATVEVRTAGNNVIVHLQGGGGNIDGTFTGTWTVDEWDVIHASGSISIHGWNTMVVTFNGAASGTVLIRYEGKADAATGVFHGTFAIVSGTGGLATLHGQGTVWVENGVGGYAFRYHFEP